MFQQQQKKTGTRTQEALQTKKDAASDHKWSSICRSLEDTNCEEMTVVGTKPTQQHK